jgi:hypothetical protein
MVAALAEVARITIATAARVNAVPIRFFVTIIFSC